jgi:signal transduction histidine kinase
VKNPINAIVIHLEILRERVLQLDPETRRHMDVISAEIHRLDRVVKTLVDFSRPVELKLQGHDLRELAAEVASLATPDARLHGVEIVQQMGEAQLPVRVDSDLMKQAILNVVLNGVQAMPNGGTLTLRTYATAQAAVLDIQDTGPGIPPEIRDKIFNLYFTTKKTGSTDLSRIAIAQRRARPRLRSWQRNHLSIYASSFGSGAGKQDTAGG